MGPQVPTLQEAEAMIRVGEGVDQPGPEPESAGSMPEWTARAVGGSRERAPSPPIIRQALAGETLCGWLAADRKPRTG